MATKNISITEEAYNRLARLRKGNESFSELIIEVTGNVNLMDYFGILSKEKGDKLEKNITLLKSRDKKIQAEKMKELFGK
ncbi:MAG: antitoxin VapB family protein [Nanoarchaeota archaeon]